MGKKTVGGKRIKTRHPVDAPAARAIAAKLNATERAIKPGNAALERAVIGPSATRKKI